MSLNYQDAQMAAIFRHTALNFLEIKQLFLRKFALSGEKIARHWSFRQFKDILQQTAFI